MKDNIYFLNHAKRGLEEVLEAYDDLTFGVYNITGPKNSKLKN